MIRLAAVFLGLMPWLLFEVGLRAIDPSPPEAVDLAPWVSLEQSRPLFQLDATAGRWRVPAERMNFFRPASFSATKHAGTKRIFVLGGSTVQGRPFAHETSFSAWLDIHLRADCPDQEFEVINCGGVSYASYRVAKILDEILNHQPDAIVLYTGHNEFLEERMYAEVRTMGAIQRWASRVGSRLRTVQWLREKLSADLAPPAVLDGEVNARLDSSGGLERYQRDPIWRTGVEKHFSQTFRSMVFSAKRAGVPLIVCLPASDLVNTPPIKTTRLATLGRESLHEFDSAWSLAIDSDLDNESRLNACVDCLSVDPEHAGTHYLMGRLHYENGNSSAALQHLVAARDHDVCPLRATSPIVDGVLRIANEQRLLVIDCNALLDRLDSSGRQLPDGIVDPDLFIDHVHPTIVGHQIIAAEVAEKIRILGWYHSVDTAQKDCQELAAAHLGTLGEEYFARGKQRLEGLRRWAAGRAGEIGAKRSSAEPASP